MTPLGPLHFALVDTGDGDPVVVALRDADEVLAAEDMAWAPVDDDDNGDVRVSTVFTGMNLSFGRPGPPMVFETMVFGGPHDGHQRRYATYADAVRGHADVLAMATATAP